MHHSLGLDLFERDGRGLELRLDDRVKQAARPVHATHRIDEHVPAHVLVNLMGGASVDGVHFLGWAEDR